MNSKEEIRILAIESSCDETAAAVVVNGRGCPFEHHIFPDSAAYIIWRRSA